jgi:hypothetical protein
MATTPTGVEVPAGTDAFDPDGHMRALAASLEGRIIVPVPNVTARAALAAAVSPSTTEPLYVDRANAHPARRLESTTDGTTWIPVGAQYAWMGIVTTGALIAHDAVITGSAISTSTVGAKLPYATKLHIQIAGTAGYNSAGVNVSIQLRNATGSAVPVQMVGQSVPAAGSGWAPIAHMGYVDLPANTEWGGSCVAVTSGPSAYYRLGIHVTRVPA